MLSTKNILLSGAFLYIFISPFLFHPDIKTIFYISQFLSGGTVNIYQFLADNPAKAILGPFVYPPLAYFLFGILFVPVKLLAGGGFAQWLAMGNTAVDVPHLARYLFLIKLPILLTFLYTGWVLAKQEENRKDATLALLIWLFNPISIYVVGAMGQFDVVPALLTLLALFWARKNPYFSALSLGLGGALKSYPLLLIPFLLVKSAGSWKKKASLLLTSAVAYAVFTIPFLKTPAFYQDAFASNLSQRIFHAGLPLGFGEQILLVPALLIGLLLWAAADKRDNLISYFLPVTLLPIALAHFHPQWAVWSLPFLCIVVARHKLWFPAIVYFAGWLGTVLFFDDKFLTWGLLSPFDTGLFFLPSIASLVKPLTDPLLVQSIAHTLLAASALWIVTLILLKRRHE